MNSLSPGVLNPLYKQKLIDYLTGFLTEMRSETSQVNTWGTDVIEKLSEFIKDGKMIRGSLVLFISEAYAGNLIDDAIRIGSAIELFHSSLLIHDDIMDNDTYRRGQPTIFAQYQSSGDKENLPQSRHFGESMGICVGDIGFFLAFQLLSEVKNNTKKQIITDVCLNEMISVGIAQMQDVYAGHAEKEVLEKDIENVYLYKTGRYTFALPMKLGAILANQNNKTLQELELLGENIGLLFQLKDDQLSLFGSQEKTGKPEGSDIRENKKTLYRFYLFGKVSLEQRKELNKIFGKGTITHDEIEYIRKLIKNLAIQDMIDQKMQSLHNKAKEIIMNLSLQKRYKDHLLELLDFISNRKK